MTITIPDDVREYINNVFKNCNDRVSKKLTTNPNSWETSLDMTLIEALTNYSTTVKLPSNWLIRIDTHYLGGMRHWNNWEIADIGILVFFRKGGKTIKSKVALFQSKRLYPNEVELDEDKAENYYIGFGRLFPEDEQFNKVLRPRTFSFDQSSKYKAFKIKDEQCEAIVNYENKSGIPVHYLLYNTNTIPYKIDIPITSEVDITTNEVGCRVIPADKIYNQFKKEKKGAVPSYGELKYLLDAPFNVDEHASGWRLEYFVSELFLNCEQGYIIQDKDDINLENLFYRRSGPIAAAFSITFDIGE